MLPFIEPMEGILQILFFHNLQLSCSRQQKHPFPSAIVTST